jgi:hypothetical protein
MAKITCPNPECKTVSALPDVYVGRPVRCKKCKTIFTPAPASAVTSGPPPGPSDVITVVARRVGTEGEGTYSLVAAPRQGFTRRWIAAAVAALVLPILAGGGLAIFLWLTSPPAAPGERFGGIEIGSKGVNYVHFEIFPDEEKGYNWRILDKDSAKTSLTKGMDERGDFDPERLAETVKAVRVFYDCLRKQHHVPPDKIFISGSSSLPKAFVPRQGGDKAAVVQMRKSALTEAVEQATDKRMEFVDVEEELRLQVRGAVPIRDHHKALYVDVGTGNTRAGYLKRSGLVIKFEGPGIRDTVKDRLADAGLRERFQKEIKSHGGVRATEKAYLAGAISWVMATYLHPSERGTYVTFKPGDIDRFAEAVKDKDYLGTFVVPPGLPAEEAEKLKEDVQMIQEIFQDHAQLVAGAEILKALAAELEFSKKELRFFRYSHLAVLFASVYEKSGHEW